MLREIELAGRFGVSRGPVRDAFIQLSHEGFLSYYANRGVMVRHPPNPDEREFITSIRRQIEIHIIEKGVAEVTDEGVAKIEFALDQLKAACSGGEATSIALRDIEFHETIIRVCGGEDMVGAWRQLCSRMLMMYTRHVDYDQTYREHLDIFNAIVSKSPEAAIAAINANIK